MMIMMMMEITVSPAMLMLWPDFQDQAPICKAASGSKQYSFYYSPWQWGSFWLSCTSWREEGPKVKGKYDPPVAGPLPFLGFTGILITSTSEGAPMKVEPGPLINEASKQVPLWAQVKTLPPRVSHR